MILEAQKLKTPFPWFGGKSKAAPLIWDALGDVPNYIEPFAGSIATLLARPHTPNVETINDIDNYIVNFWRSVKHDPEKVAEHANQPVFETDLTARHLWLVNNKHLLNRLEADPDFYDSKIAGWWVWGLSNWIGNSFCSGDGPWNVNEDFVLEKRKCEKKDGISKRLHYLKSNAQGIKKYGINKALPDIGRASGKGMQRKQLDINSYLNNLSDRLKNVRVCSGDWQRILSDSPLFASTPTGVLLDPPYEQFEDVYTHNQTGIATKVKEWAISNGDNPKLRIVLCGYDVGDMPSDWSCVNWSAPKGYQVSENKLRHNEQLWLSPHCLKPQQDLFS